MRNKFGIRLLVVISLGACVLIVGWVVFERLSLKTLTINYQNIEKVELYSTEKLNKGESEKPLREVVLSGQEIKLKKGKYTLKYYGAENYQSLFIEIELNEKFQTVDLRPSFTEEYLNSQLDAELSTINKQLLETFPKIKGLYKINRGKLYHDGEWYGTTLVYKGKDISNSDSLRVALKKEASGWSVKSNPPDIYLSKHVYPDIPVDVLREINILPVPIPDLKE